jgi:hypothetical protein
MVNVMFWRRRQPWWERYGVGFEMKLPSFEKPSFDMPSFDMPKFRAPEMPHVNVPYYHRQSGFDWGRWWPYMLGAALIGAAFAYFYKQGFGPVEEYVFPSTSHGNGASHRDPVTTYGSH